MIFQELHCRICTRCGSRNNSGSRILLSNCGGFSSVRWVVRQVVNCVASFGTFAFLLCFLGGGKIRHQDSPDCFLSCKLLVQTVGCCVSIQCTCAQPCHRTMRFNPRDDVVLHRSRKHIVGVRP